VRISYGTAKSQLGYVRSASGISQVPPSAVIATDGLWVCDPVKKRLVNYSLTGTYQGEFSGISSTATDMAETADGSIVIIANSTGGSAKLQALTGDRQQVLAPVSVGQADSLLPTDGTLGVHTGDGYHPVSSDLRVDKTKGVTSARGTVDFVANSRDHATVALRPYWVDQLNFSVGAPPGGITVSPISIAVEGGRVHLWLSAAGRAVTSTVGGQFYLRLGRTGTIEVFEKVAGGTLAGVARTMLLGPDKRVYQWYVDTKGAELRVRTDP
jgi:hypothetical protein